jgi:diguanylate cyclase (GGDEF)-like protein
MAQLIDYLTELTGFRDRDVIDITLARTLWELLRPHSVVICRPVGNEDDRRWVTRAHQTGDSTDMSADFLWADLETLPRLLDHPLRCAAIEGQATEGRRGEHHISVYPLSNERAVLGVLEIETKESLDPQAHSMTLGILRLYRNYQSLLDYSEHDTLTGLLNRKSFDESFSKIVLAAPQASAAEPGDRRTRLARGQYFLAMIDIDHFKSVNDRHGHLIGDEVLLLLARLMGRSFRPEDRLYRFGGEEFVVVLRCDTHGDAARVLERFRATTELQRFPQVNRITISIGFTQISAGDSPIAALGRADKAIYYAKEHGRNQVRGYSDLAASGAVDLVENVGTVELF